jgi:hypothetical protein
MDAQFLLQLPQVEAMCTALYTAQVGVSTPAQLLQVQADSLCSPVPKRSCAFNV